MRYNIIAISKNDIIRISKYNIITILTCVLFILLSCFKSFAVTTMSGVSIYIDSAISEGTFSTDVSAYTMSERYEVESVTVTNAPSASSDGWSESAKPKLTIKLRIVDTSSYKFGSVKKDSVSIYGDPGDSSKASVTGVSTDADGSTLTVKYTMAPLDSSEDDEEYELYSYNTQWDKQSGTAYWEGGDDAKYFKLILYRGSETAATVTTSNTSSFCLAKYFTKGGNYKFTVQAFASSSKKGNVASSSTISVTQAEAKDIYDNYKDETDKNTNVKDLTTSSQAAVTSSAAGGSNNAAGSWVIDNNGWWYRYSDGSYPISKWEYINGKWYYFNQDGYMLKGWQQIGGSWYYLDPTNGDMWVSRSTPDGYTLDVSGKMVTNSVIIQDMTNIAGSWVLDNNGWWYRYSDGSYPTSSWKQINGEWYYFNKDGYILKDWQEINGVYYYFDPTSGAMWHDRYTPNGYYLDSSGASNRTAVTVYYG